MRNAAPQLPDRRAARVAAACAALTLLACGTTPTPRADAVVAPFPKPFQVIAHRGASAYAPENTLPAFRRARELGAVEVELDVQLTRDDRVVLFHDETLDRKTDATGRVRDHTLSELLRVEIGRWFDETHPGVEERYAGTRLDPLEDLFEEMGRSLVYHVELKSDDAELPRHTLALVDRYELRDRVVFTSFSFEQVERAHALAPELLSCLLIRPEDRREGSIRSWIDRAHAAGLTQVGVASSELDPELVAYARARGLWIRAWRVKSVEDMEHAIAVGANGMTIDWPEKLIERLLEHVGTAGAAR